MIPFLDCNIWSVVMIEDNFALVESVYYYNSLLGDVNTLEISTTIGSIQIPEFEIQNLHLLKSLDFNVINQNTIPILKKIENYWTIDLYYYEQYSNL